MTLLEQLEKESLEIIRDVIFANDFDRMVVLYSLGKDSSVLLHLFEKAFHPRRIPINILHIDTGYKFPEMYAFKNEIQSRYKNGLRTFKHPAGLNPWDHKEEYTDIMKTEALKTALCEYGYKIAFCGARRDEEKSRAKEHIISLRDENYRWDPRNQNPEFPSLLNPFVREGESSRIFPLSNWTEVDIWQYIRQEGIEILPLYFTHQRRVVEKEGLLLSSFSNEGEMRRVRFRTLGCWPLTGAVEEEAGSIEEIIASLKQAKYSERTNRTIDYDQEGAMERRKQNGYF